MKNKIKFFIILSIIFFGLLSLISFFLKNTSIKTKPNVILIMVDDLRPEINCYNKTLIKSPNIDDLASDSYLYENAVCNYPVCGASRASMLSGLRPNKNRFKTYKSRIDVDAPSVGTIGSWFKNNGYYTLSYGKILHQKNDSPKSWSEPAWRAEKKWRDYQTKENLQLAQQNDGVANAFEIGTYLEDDYADKKMIDRVNNDILNLKENNQPFLLSVGFLKPHLPFNAPSKYWNLYNKQDIQLAKNRFQPKNTPQIAMHHYAELRKYLNIPNDKSIEIPDSTQLKLIHGYYACISFVDDQIGRFLSRLKELDLYNDAIIIFVGDHGWQLGEHNLWAKHCNFQTSLKVPLLIKYPNQKKTKKIKSVVELIDIFPTLCDLASLNYPKHLQGKSLISLNKHDSSNSVGFSKYHKGTTITSSNYSYTKWLNDNNELIGQMLFDLKRDKDENTSIAIDSTYEQLINQFSKRIDSINEINL